MTAQHSYQQGHDTLYDEGVALGGKEDLAIDIVCLQPYTTLTTVDQVALNLLFRIQWRLLIT